MKRFLIPVLLLCVTATLAVADDDRAGVERAVLDYVEGVYEMKPELIERSVHPEMKKFGFARRKPTDDWRVIPTRPRAAAPGATPQRR